jgi:hypothetical protein
MVRAEAFGCSTQFLLMACLKLANQAPAFIPKPVSSAEHSMLRVVVWVYRSEEAELPVAAQWSLCMTLLWVPDTTALQDFLHKVSVTAYKVGGKTRSCQKMLIE